MKGCIKIELVYNFLRYHKFGYYYIAFALLVVSTVPALASLLPTFRRL